MTSFLVRLGILRKTISNLRYLTVVKSAVLGCREGKAPPPELDRKSLSSSELFEKLFILTNYLLTACRNEGRTSTLLRYCATALSACTW